MTILTISSSHDPASRSEMLARKCVQALLGWGCVAPLLLLKDHPLPAFAGGDLAALETYRTLHEAVSSADALVLASPVYNWGCCAELKKFVEFIGSTPPDLSVRGAFFDQPITFVNAAGLPHSYMAFTGLANSMMLDFKCIVNPYNVYVHSSQWDGNRLEEKAQARLEKSMRVAVELATLLGSRTYRSGWEI